MRSFAVTLSVLCAWAALVSHVTATKGVFCHYLVGGMTADQAAIDVKEAKAMGIDAFALNVVTLDSWSNDAVQMLFDAAFEQDFKLFFSFDMTHFTAPQQFLPLIQEWHANESYYLEHTTEKPFVSTFYGGTMDFGYDSVNDGWQALYKDALSAQGIDTYFVPAFSDFGGDASEFFTKFPMADGVFNWDSWANATVNATIEAGIDLEYMAGAEAAKKSFIMGISAVQFKHLDSDANWYRGNTIDLADRISQILSIQPDYIEIQTWNDGGESHYIGNIWPYSIDSTPSIVAQVTDYNHTAFQVPISHLITAYKNGDEDLSACNVTAANGVEGVFWYHALLSTAECANDPLAKPAGMDLIDNVVTVAILLGEAGANTTINVFSDGTMIGSEPGHVGLNAWSAPNVKVGKQYVEVVKSDGTVLASATGNMSVVADADLCNFNFQVVELV